MLFYLYCIVRRERPPAAVGMPAGLAGASRPQVLACGRGLWCIGADVPPDRYGPDSIEAGLRDLDWVSRIALAHEAVVEHFARDRTATVVPMKLFTIFSSRNRACEEMRRRAPELRGILRRIAGCQEWGIRIARTAQPARATSLGPAAETGAAFLAAKKVLRDRAREGARVAAAAAEDAFGTVAGLARSVRRHAAPRGAERPPLVDAALLVPVSSRARFAAAAKQAARACRAGGVELTLTGPWPAYNFIQPERRR